jgi:RNA polymerase sigma factor (sigma-70 family)
MSDRDHYGGAMDEAQMRLCLEQVQKQVAKADQQVHFGTHEALDIQQEVLLALLTALPRYDPSLGDFRSFTGGVVRLQVRFHLRTRQRRERHYDRSVAAASLLGDDTRGRSGRGRVAPWRDGSGDDPSRLAVAREERERLEQGLRRLTDDERRLWQCKEAGMTTEEIARAFGSTVEREKSRWRRLRDKLRRLVGSDE